MWQPSLKNMSADLQLPPEQGVHLAPKGVDEQQVWLSFCDVKDIKQIDLLIIINMLLLHQNTMPQNACELSLGNRV